MLHIFCALKHEARPIIDHYRLVHDGAAQAFTCYRNDDITLTVTGVGKQAAAAGTQFAAEYFRAAKSDTWLNIGIAGHRSLPIGTVVLANRVTDAADGTAWNPCIRFQTYLITLPLITLDQPAKTYPDNAMVDMEATGFCRSASKYGVLEQIHCLKIISDNESHRSETISKQVVLELVSSNLVAIADLITQLRAG